MSTDINLLRSIATLVGFVAFLLLVWQVWRRTAPSEHQRAAQLPFLEDEGVKRDE